MATLNHFTTTFSIWIEHFSFPSSAWDVAALCALPTNCLFGLFLGAWRFGTKFLGGHWAIASGRKSFQSGHPSLGCLIFTMLLPSRQPLPGGTVVLSVPDWFISGSRVFRHIVRLLRPRGGCLAVPATGRAVPWFLLFCLRHGGQHRGGPFWGPVADATKRSNSCIALLRWPDRVTSGPARPPPSARHISNTSRQRT